MNSKVGNRILTNSSKVKVKTGYLTPVREFNPFLSYCLSTSVEKVPSIVSAVDVYVNK